MERWRLRKEAARTGLPSLYVPDPRLTGLFHHIIVYVNLVPCPLRDRCNCSTFEREAPGS